MALPPGPRGPATLNTARFMRRPLETLTAWQQRYGDVFSTRLLVFGVGVYVADPKAIAELFTGDQSDLLAGEANSVLTPFVGERSVLVLDGPDHIRERKLLLPPFTGSRIAGFRAEIAAVAEREIARWPRGEKFALRPRMQALTFEVISRVVFGVHDPARVELLRGSFAELLQTGAAFLTPERLRYELRGLTPWGAFKRRLRRADALLREEIATRRRAPDLEERADVLSLLIRARDEDGEPLSDEELRDEVVTLLAAGHETTATGLAFAFDLLLHDPGALDRLRAALAGAEADADAHLDAVVKETLRLRPVIDAAERTLTRPREVGGWMLPAGIRVYPAIALVHRRPDLYPEPLEFRPERYVGNGATSYAWLPFGGGIRRCIGASLAQLEMAEVIRAVVRDAELRPVRPVTDPVRLRGITLAPVHGVEVMRN